MSRPAIALALGAVFSAFTTGSFAQDGIPDITGIWSVSAGSVILADGTVNQYPDDYDANEIEVTKQTGSVFSATQKISPKAGTSTGSHGGLPFEGNPNPMVGAIDGTGPYVVFADVGDSTVLRCTLVDEQTMRCLVAEAGEEAVAGFLLYKRKQ